MPRITKAAKPLTKATKRKNRAKLTSRANVLAEVLASAMDEVADIYHDKGVKDLIGRGSNELYCLKNVRTGIRSAIKALDGVSEDSVVVESKHCHPGTFEKQVEQAAEFSGISVSTLKVGREVAVIPQAVAAEML
jgi:hypothetical protein